MIGINMDKAQFSIQTPTPAGFHTTTSSTRGAVLRTEASSGAEPHPLFEAMVEMQGEVTCLQEVGMEMGGSAKLVKRNRSTGE